MVAPRARPHPRRRAPHRRRPRLQSGLPATTGPLASGSRSSGTPSASTNPTSPSRSICSSPPLGHPPPGWQPADVRARRPGRAQLPTASRLRGRLRDPRRRRALTEGLANAGVGLVGLGLLPGSPRPRALHSPRYDAMEAHFDAFGPAGRTMMRQTAAIQVNVDLGAEDGAEPVADRARARTAARGRLRELAVRGERAFGLVLHPAGGVARDRARPSGAGRRGRHRRIGVGRLLAAGAGDVHPGVRTGLRPGLRAPVVRRLDPRRPRARMADRGRPRVPPDDAVPADPAPRLARAADGRLVAFGVVDRAGDRRGRAARRRGRVAADRAGARATRRALDRRGARRAAPSRTSPGPRASASRPRSTRCPGSAPNTTSSMSSSATASGTCQPGALSGRRPPRHLEGDRPARPRPGRNPDARCLPVSTVDPRPGTLWR